jgi:hypothetical protein
MPKLVNVRHSTSVARLVDRALPAEARLQSIIDPISTERRLNRAARMTNKGAPRIPASVEADDTLPKAASERCRSALIGVNSPERTMVSIAHTVPVARRRIRAGWRDDTVAEALDEDVTCGETGARVVALEDMTCPSCSLRLQMSRNRVFRLLPCQCCGISKN